MRTGSSRREGQSISLPRRASWLNKSDIVVFLAGMFLILGGAALTIQRDYSSAMNLWKSRLSEVVLHQTWTLSNSLQQSQDDAQVLANFAPTRTLLRGGAATDAAAQNQVSSLFNDLRSVYGYAAIFLLDSKQNVLQKVSADSPRWTQAAESSAFAQVFSQAMESAEYQVKVVQNPGQALFLIFALPVFSGANHHSAPIGVVAMFDPFAQELLPLITSGDFPMHTAETVLLRLHDGNVPTGGPRYLTGPAAAGIVSRTDTIRAAATEAIDEQAYFGEFVDYRGTHVLAALEKISSLDSVVIFKVNRDEALSEHHRTARLETYAAIAITLAYAGLLLVVRGNRVQHEMRSELSQEHLLNERLESIVAQRTKELAQMNAELESRVQHRTAELQAANKELAAFAYSVSHDLRAPLRGIDGWGQALLEDYGSQLDSLGKQYLDRVLSETRRMGNLIEDMLLLSRLSQDEMHLNPVDLSAMAEKIMTALRDANPNRMIRFVAAPALIVPGDARLLEIAMTNLLSNAVKFTGRRQAAFIEFGAVQNGGGAEFFIRDNGAGFDMKYATTLFGPFQRLHQESEFSGTGIGLAIVQRVIARHGGRVWADAHVDKGATFWFTFGAPAG